MNEPTSGPNFQTLWGQDSMLANTWLGRGGMSSARQSKFLNKLRVSVKNNLWTELLFFDTKAEYSQVISAFQANCDG